MSKNTSYCLDTQKKDKICYLNLTWGNGYHKRFVSRPSVETPHCDIS